MQDMNELHLTGRVVRDVELRSNSNGSPYVWFTLVVDSKRDKDGKLQGDFITCQAWGKPAEFLAKFAKKSTRLLISKGALRTFSKLEEDGSKRSYTYVFIISYEFIDGIKTRSKESVFDGFGEGVEF